MLRNQNRAGEDGAIYDVHEVQRKVEDKVCPVSWSNFNWSFYLTRAGALDDGWKSCSKVSKIMFDIAKHV